MRQFVHRLIGRLSVSRKLTLIYVLDLSAVIFVSTILINEKYIAIDFTRKEVVGNAYIAQVRAAIFTDSNVPASADSPAERVAFAERRYGKGMRSAEQSAALVRQLEQDAPGVGGYGAVTAAAAQALITRVGNHSNLILDPDLDSYYAMSLVILRFPELYGLVGQIGEKALAVREARTPASRAQRQTEYLIVEGRLDAVASGISADYEEALDAGKAGLRAHLSPSRERLLSAIEGLREQTRQVALEAGFRPSAREVNAMTSELRDALAEAWERTGTSLDELLALRIEGLFTRMWWHLGTAVMLLLLILSVVFYVARMIARPIKRLSEVAERVSASADYSLRATWSSGDEIGRLVHAFNEMLGQLDRFRRIEQELAANARAALAQRELLEAIPIPLMVTAIPRHEVLHANHPATAWLHGQKTDPWMRGLDASHRVRFFQQLADFDEVREFEAVWHGGGDEHWMLLSATRLRYQDQDAVLTAFTPIGRLKQMEAGLELWAKVFEASSESIMITNAEREVVTVNRAFCRSTAYDLSEVVGNPPDLLRSDHYSDGHFDQVWKAATARGSWQGELWLRRKTGEVFPVWAVLNAVRDAEGLITHYVAAFLDVSERKENERRIRHLAHHDTLTDLPNRALCLDRLNMAIQQADRNNKRVGVLFIDLDRFKNINDSLGHHIGDGLLRSVARRLLDAVRAGDTVSRHGGDEFVVIFNGVKDVDEVRHIVERRLIPPIRRPHDVDGAELCVSCSVGIALYPEDGRDVDTLMRNADAAMYQAKQAGRNNAQFFTAELDRNARERMEIERDLRGAAERGELFLLYQPRVDVRSGRLIGVEALVRWNHPEWGVVSPGRFIPVAEETGLIVPIGYWIFGEACRQQAEWREAGSGVVPVSVNLSPAQFRDAGLLEAVRTTLQVHAIDPRHIEFELTESLLMEDMSNTIDLLQAIKDIGISLSVDDFGTGYSSLNYLYRFPIDRLKIDQSFVCDMLDDPKDLAITQAIIGLGHALGLRVVAEGVESAEQEKALAAAGCDELQGFYFSKPLAAGEVPARGRTLGRIFSASDTGRDINAVPLCKDQAGVSA
ncbi:EAL domain-containing protein [Propionivibrio soli]|uniref:bifunctional diguanylate cyclase/phosphodiesterase n=1 Tax=Propionivibrio soli TaxID=2976531 RepID=UPI0021E815AD|nr:EAL domain-containing protein [Propionivibrio soli]